MERKKRKKETKLKPFIFKSVAIPRTIHVLIAFVYKTEEKEFHKRNQNIWFTAIFTLFISYLRTCHRTIYEETIYGLDLNNTNINPESVVMLMLMHSLHRKSSASSSERNNEQHGDGDILMWCLSKCKFQYYLYFTENKSIIFS